MWYDTFCRNMEYGLWHTQMWTSLCLHSIFFFCWAAKEQDSDHLYTKFKALKQSSHKLMGDVVIDLHLEKTQLVSNLSN